MESNPTVFVVDGDASIRASVRDLVSTMNFRCQEYDSGREFLHSYDENWPGCLITEVRLPETNGLWVQEGLRARGAALPVIFLSNETKVSIAVRAMRAGAIDFIQKPFQDHHLWSVIEESVRMDRELRAGQRRQEELQARLDTLNAEERRVLDLIIDGNTNKTMAVELGVSLRTVEHRRSRLMKKLKTSTLLELVQFGVAIQRESPFERRPAAPLTGRMGNEIGAKFRIAFNNRLNHRSMMAATLEGS